MPEELRLRVEDAEERDTGRVLDVAVGAWLIQLVRAEARTCSRGVGLYGEALVEEPLLVDPAQQPP